MGAAWRDLAGRKSGFEKILKMVTEVRGMGMEGQLAFHSYPDRGARERGDSKLTLQCALRWACCRLIKHDDSKRPA